jgi:hypothetical protein
MFLFVKQIIKDKDNNFFFKLNSNFLPFVKTNSNEKTIDN